MNKTYGRVHQIVNKMKSCAFCGKPADYLVKGHVAPGNESGYSEVYYMCSECYESKSN